MLKNMFPPLSSNFPISVARTCSLIYIILDVLKPLQHKKLLEHELEGFGIRLNQSPPNISFRKKDKGGVNLTCSVNINIVWLVLHYIFLITVIISFIRQNLNVIS